MNYLKWHKVKDKWQTRETVLQHIWQSINTLKSSNKSIQKRQESNRKIRTQKSISQWQTSNSKYAFSFTNNAWNTNSGIKKRMIFFLHVQIYIASLCQGYGETDTLIIAWRWCMWVQLYRAPWKNLFIYFGFDPASSLLGLNPWKLLNGYTNTDDKAFVLTLLKEGKNVNRGIPK